MVIPEPPGRQPVSRLLAAADPAKALPVSMVFADPGFTTGPRQGGGIRKEAFGDRAAVLVIPASVASCSEKPSQGILSPASLQGLRRTASGTEAHESPGAGVCPLATTPTCTCLSPCFRGVSEAHLVCHPRLAHPGFRNLPQLQYPWELGLDLPACKPGAFSELETGP